MFNVKNSQVFENEFFLKHILKHTAEYIDSDPKKELSEKKRKRLVCITCVLLTVAAQLPCLASTDPTKVCFIGCFEQYSLPHF